MEAIEFDLANLPTKSVTFTPSSAAIVCEIPVSIQPGPNQITITGLDPRVIADSIRIDGSGSATITDLQTSTVPRVDKFDDELISPDADESSSDTDTNVDVVNDDPALTQINNSLQAAETALTKSRNEAAAALAELQLLDVYGHSMDPKEVAVSALAEFLQLYRQRREAGSEVHVRASEEITERQKEIENLIREKKRLEGRIAKEKELKGKERQREKKKKVFELAQREKARQRDREEKRKFWTIDVGRVIVRLDGHGHELVDDTPESSRRSSVVVDTSTSPDHKDKDMDKKGGTRVTLCLSYVLTKGLASWTPRYDLAINTPTSTTHLVYRAEFCNTSTETWRDARVVFASSQAQFSRLDERVPTLRPWRVKLGDSKGDISSSSMDWCNVLQSRDETDARLWETRYEAQRAIDRRKRASSKNQTGTELLAKQHGFPPLEQPRLTAPLFKPADQVPVNRSLFGGVQSQQPVSGFGLLGQQATSPFAQPGQRPTSSALFGSAQPQQPASGFGQARPQGQSSSLFGQTQQPRGQSSSLFGQPSQRQSGLFGQGLGPRPPQGPSLFSQPDTAQVQEYSMTGLSQPQQGEQTRSRSPSPSPPPEEEEEEDTPLHHQSTTHAQTGLTTTYAPSSARPIQINPSSTPHRQLLSTLDLPSTLSYTIIPKHRTSAFLSARIKNTSDITLLKGAAGITVDGSFLGSVGSASLFSSSSSSSSSGVGCREMVKNACVPGESLTLSLGIDPAISVTYSAPSVKKGSTNPSPESAGMGTGIGASMAGFFSRKSTDDEDKDEVAVFRRVCTVRNGKDVSVDIVVVEQVPVPISDDDVDSVDGDGKETTDKEEETKLDITIRQPIGLTKHGDKVGFPWPAGEGTVSLNKNGEVRWEVSLPAGEEGRFVLEYEARVPKDTEVLEG